MKKNKVMALCLAGSMALPVTVGAAENNAGAEYYPICEEPITITIAGSLSGTTDPNATEFVEQAEEQLGIKIDYQGYNDESWKTQVTLMLAGDEFPDMMAPLWEDIGKVNTYGADGYLLPINEYLDIMPAFSAYLEEHPDYAAVLTAPDGNIYGITPYEERLVPRMKRAFINKTWLENLGLEAPTTAEELYEVLKAFKEQDANGNGDPDDEIPLSSTAFGNGAGAELLNIMHMFGIFSNTMSYSPVVDENGTVQLGQATDNYKEMLKYINKLYEEGLLDSESFIQTYDEIKAKMADGRIGVVNTSSAPFVLAGEDISYDDNWQYLDGLTSEVNDIAAAVYSPGASSTVNIAVSADTEHPEEICRFIDWLFTVDGAIAGTRGFIDVSTYWKEVPAIEGLATAEMIELEDIEKKYPGEYSSQEEYRYKKATINNAFNVRGISEGTAYGAKETMTEEELLLYCEHYGYTAWSDSMEFARRELTWVDCFPTLAYTPEDADRRTTLLTDIQMYIEQAYGQFVTGELDVEKDWDTYISTLKQIGMDELIAIEQATYDAAMK